MPVIRREDKEIIHNLSLLGMLFGAFVGGFLILHFHNKASQRHAAAAAAEQTHSSLVRLSSNLSAQEVSVAQAVIGQVQPDITPLSETEPEEKSLWLRLSRWGLWSLCGSAIVTGAGAGYLSLWGAGWLGSIMTYWLIRFIYRVIRKTAPECSAAKRPVASAGNTYTYQRDENRLLPTLVKLFMLLTMALGVLAVVVWQLTAM